VERLLLLWDELDEYVGLGYHFVVGLGHSVAQGNRRLRSLIAAPLARTGVSGASETSIS
jgi:hypothetical protein